MEEKDYEAEMLPTDLPKEIPERSATPENQHYEEHEARTLLSWNAPGRPFRKKSRQFYMTVILIAFLVEVILFLFGQYSTMIVVAAFVFVGFALVSVPPRSFNYKIGTEGVTVEDHFYIWKELYDFYFKRRDGVDVLCIRTEDMIPGVLTLTLDGVTKEQVRNILLSYLPYREIIKPSFIEKSSDWLVKNFPMEKPR